MSNFNINFAINSINELTKNSLIYEELLSYSNLGIFSKKLTINKKLIYDFFEENKNLYNITDDFKNYKDIENLYYFLLKDTFSKIYKNNIQLLSTQNLENKREEISLIIKLLSQKNQEIYNTFTNENTQIYQKIHQLKEIEINITKLFKQNKKKFFEYYQNTQIQLKNKIFIPKFVLTFSFTLLIFISISTVILPSKTYASSSNLTPQKKYELIENKIKEKILDIQNNNKLSYKSKINQIHELEYEKYKTYKEVMKAINNRNYNLDLSNYQKIFDEYKIEQSGAKINLNAQFKNLIETNIDDYLDNNMEEYKNFAKTVIKTFEIKYKKFEILETTFTYSTQLQLDPLFVIAVIKTESSFNMNAESRKGAIGLMQIIPGAAGVDVNGKKNEDFYYNIQNNIATGVVYLKEQLNQNKGNKWLASVGYNAGPSVAGRIANKNLSKDEVLEAVKNIEETHDYIIKIDKNLKELQKKEEDSDTKKAEKKLKTKISNKKPLTEQDPKKSTRTNQTTNFDFELYNTKYNGTLTIIDEKNCPKLEYLKELMKQVTFVPPFSIFENCKYEFSGNKSNFGLFSSEDNLNWTEIKITKNSKTIGIIRLEIKS